MQKNNGVVIFLPYPRQKVDLHLWRQKNNVVSKKYHVIFHSVNSAIV